MNQIINSVKLLNLNSRNFLFEKNSEFCKRRTNLLKVELHVEIATLNFAHIFSPMSGTGCDPKSFFLLRAWIANPTI